MVNVLIRNFRPFPWVTNVTVYGCLFAGGDFVHQWFTRKTDMDWRHTRNVATVAFSFHGNFSFFWMRFLERRFPGNSARMVVRKLFLDQSMAAPLATTVFYTGMSVLEGKPDILQDWREKFLNTYKTGLMFWPFMQLVNFALVPLYLRTSFTGCCAFVWASFLCFSHQIGDGTATAALGWIFTPTAHGGHRADTDTHTHGEPGSPGPGGADSEGKEEEVLLVAKDRTKAVEAQNTKAN